MFDILGECPGSVVFLGNRSREINQLGNDTHHFVNRSWDMKTSSIMYPLAKVVCDNNQLNHIYFLPFSITAETCKDKNVSLFSLQMLIRRCLLIYTRISPVYMAE